MAKRRESGFDVVAAWPWPVVLGLGLLAFIGIQYGIGWLWGSSSNPFLASFAKVASMGVYNPIAWFALIIACLAAFVSFTRRRQRRALLQSQTCMDSLRSMDWRSFELLVGEAFRRQGYAVEETGQGGADGGIDLKLRKDGTTTLVQCKQWRSQRVGVQVVREIFAILIHEGAASVKIVALGHYTPDAAAFARGKPIELVDGYALLSTVKTIQAQKAPESALDNPLFLAGGIATSVVLALLLSTSHARPDAPITSAPAAIHRRPSLPPPSPPTPPIVHASAKQAAAIATPKVYKAEPPMSDAELRDWEKRNREAMKILEKTTPELQTPPPH